VVVFGSLLREDTFHENSDLDLAIQAELASPDLQRAIALQNVYRHD